MTPDQVLAVAAIGGLAALLALAAVAALAVGVHKTVTRLVDAAEERRTQREHRRAEQDLTTCQVIDALGTTTRPDHH